MPNTSDHYTVEIGTISNDKSVMINLQDIPDVTKNIAFEAQQLMKAIQKDDLFQVNNLVTKYSSSELLCKWVGHPYDATPLEYVCKEAGEDVAKIIFNFLIGIQNLSILGELTDGSTFTPFHYTASCGNSQVLELILNMEVIDINVKTKNMQSALHLAALFGHETIVQILLCDERTEIDPIDYAGETPLYMAACNGHMNIVKHLIAHNANVNVKSQFGLTPLLGAACKGRSDIVLKLLEHGADATASDEDRDTALHFLKRNCSYHLLKKLLQTGAMLGVSNRIGITPLHGLKPEILQQVLDESIVFETIQENDKLMHKYMKDDKTLKLKNPFVSDNDYINVCTDLKNFKAISQSKKHEYLVFHPFFKALIDMKWQVVQKIYFIKLVIFILFVLSLSYNIFSTHNTEKCCETLEKNVQNESKSSETNDINVSLNNTYDIMHLTMYVTLWILLIFLLIIRLLEMVFHWNVNCVRPMQWFEIFFMIFTLIFLLYLYDSPAMGVTLIVLAWSQAFLNVSRYPLVSPLFYTFCFISKNFLKFILFSFLLLVGFLLAFHFVLRGTKNEEQPWAFNTMSSTALKLASMTLGEVTYDEFFKQQEKYNTWAPLLALFIFFICFVLLNMMNGLAVTDTQDLKLRSEFATIVAQGDMILSFEEQFNNTWWTNLLRRLKIFQVPKISEFVILPSTGLCLQAKPDTSIVKKNLKMCIVESASNVAEKLRQRPQTDLNELQYLVNKLSERINLLSATLDIK